MFLRRRPDPAPAPQAAPVPTAAAPASRTERRRDGRIIAVAGSSRSGKTVWTAQQVRAARRLLVWDHPKGEWALRYQCKRITTPRELVDAIRPGAPPARLAYLPGLDIDDDPAAAFAVWCRITWGYIRLYGAPVVAEELSSVTHPGKAAAAWGNVCRMGMGYGSDIYAVTQRPAESDKTALGNATIVHCGRMVIPADRVTMAAYLGVTVAAVAALAPLEFLERDAMGAVKKGRL